MKSLYRHPQAALGMFTYHPWTGDGQIISIGQIDDQIYYLIDSGLPIPTADNYEFQSLTISTDLAAKLRLLAPESLHQYLKSPQELSEIQINEINTQRDIDVNAGVTVGANLYHSSNEFLLELLGILFKYQLNLQSGLQKIRTLDNKIVELEFEEIVILAKSIGDYRENIYQASWAAKDAL